MPLSLSVLTPVGRRPGLLIAITLAIGLALGYRDLPFPETFPALLLIAWLVRGSPWKGIGLALFLIGLFMGISDRPSLPPSVPSSTFPSPLYALDWNERGLAWGQANLEGVDVVVRPSLRDAPPPNASTLRGWGGTITPLSVPLARAHRPWGQSWRSEGFDYIWRPSGLDWISPPSNPPHQLPLSPQDREITWVAHSLLWGMHGFESERGALDTLRRSGLVHLLVASGLRTTFLFGLFLLLLSPLHLPKLLRLLLSLSGVVALSVHVSGLSVQRALLMLGLLVLAKGFRRPPDSLNGLGLAALVLLLVQPRLLGHLSFQLSFVAAATAILVGAIWRSQSQGGVIVKIRDLTLSGLGIHLALIPLFSAAGLSSPFWSPLANIIGIPLAGAAGLTSAVHSLWGVPGTGLIDGAFVRLFMKWAEEVASWPSPSLNPPLLWGALGAGLALGLLVGMGHRDKVAGWGTGLGFLLLGLMLHTPLPSPTLSVLPLSGSLWIPSEHALISRNRPHKEEVAILADRGIERIFVPLATQREWEAWSRHLSSPTEVIPITSSSRGVLDEWRLVSDLEGWRLSGPLNLFLPPPHKEGPYCPIQGPFVTCLETGGNGILLPEKGEVSVWVWGNGRTTVLTYR